MLKPFLLAILLLTSSCATKVEKVIKGDPIFSYGSYDQELVTKTRRYGLLKINGTYKFYPDYQSLVFYMKGKKVFSYAHGKGQDELYYDKNILKEEELKVRFMISAYETVFRATDEICSPKNSKGMSECLFVGFGESITIERDSLNKPKKLLIQGKNKTSTISITGYRK